MSPPLYATPRSMCSKGGVTAGHRAYSYCTVKVRNLLIELRKRSHVGPARRRDIQRLGRL
jgi:hypothetical protein